MRQLNRLEEKPVYRIPSSSEMFSLGEHPFHGPPPLSMPFNPAAYREDLPEETSLISPQRYPHSPTQYGTPVRPSQEPGPRPLVLEEGFQPMVPTSPPKLVQEGSSSRGAGSVSPPPLNCISICGHVSQCPVCSQLYKPCVGIYITVIVILIIVILFLLKKIFNF